MKFLIKRYLEKTWGVYTGDGMILHGKTLNHLSAPDFIDAYKKGMSSGHVGGDLSIHWRIHTALWAASQTLGLEGEFVECGVSTGMMSLAICQRYGSDISNLSKLFYLFDTFEGIPLEQASASEKAHAAKNNDINYFSCFEIASRNFRPYPFVRLVKGKIPDTLTGTQIDKVSYLSIDMNITAPERAALEHFWPRMTKGGIVLLDDYGFKGYEEQRKMADHFAHSHGRTVLNLPTGQGIIIK